MYIQCLDASGVSLRSPILDIEDKRPAVGDTVAVTGFAGSVWWTGTIEVIAWETIRKKKVLMHTVFFPADMKTSDLALLPKNYGPAKITKGRGGAKDTVKPGWVFIRPGDWGRSQDQPKTFQPIHAYYSVSCPY